MILNGEERKINSRISVSDILKQENYDFRRTAVLVNGTVIPRARYDSASVSDEDIVEIVGFVGGG